MSPDPKKTEIASKFTVRNYEEARDAGNREKIAEAIRRRFTERYIDPVSGKHGFTIMAVSCLMIEAMESFWQGWEDSERKSKRAFVFFFKRKESKPFKDFRGHACGFYKRVRCGILHQAETTGGWRIRRKGPLFDADNLTINATLFLKTLKGVLNEFCNGLKNKPWEGPLWEKVRAKMNYISEHCNL